ncbi:tetratricopeptide repeat protein [Streptomyces sp. NBC_01423]|uniref:tetratricopeptide repeat protein n=1 Tax=Streptomyces sp. NBC_01423 TaxID=2903860 RepID=UPI002E2B50E7|nr:tetratricopeptide repeat protein [Streptomyces sp. NBC_01423]
MLDGLITQDAGLRMVPVDRNALTVRVGRLRQELAALPDEAEPGRARVLSRWIGVGYLCLGRHEEARTHLRRSLALARALGDTRAVVATGINLADSYRYDGDGSAAEALYRSALDTARDRVPELVDFALQHTGKHLMEHGDLTGAEALLREALALRIAEGDGELIASTRAALARLRRLTGQ